MSALQRPARREGPERLLLLRGLQGRGGAGSAPQGAALRRLAPRPRPSARPHHPPAFYAVVPGRPPVLGESLAAHWRMTATREPSDWWRTFHMWAAWLAVVLVVLSGIPAVADEPDATAITPPRLSYLNGSVSFWRPGAEQWTAAQLNTALAPGDQLHTGHLGTVELQVGGRAFVRAWGDSELGLVDQTTDALRLKIADGHVVADLRAVDPGGIIHIETPGASFTLDRPGYYRVDVTQDVTSLTTRRDGQQAMTTRVEGGVSQTVAAPPLDAWDRWNQARTEELLYVAGTRYVPEGVYGVRDLDDHGD